METMEIVHAVLDVAGFIPKVGIAADLINAGIYACEGDWTNAALSAVAAIPGAGDAVAVVAMNIKILAKNAKLCAWAVSKANKMSAFFRLLKGKAKTGASRLMHKIEVIRRARRIKAACKKVCTMGRCFTGDTLVCTENGLRPIKEIQKGDDIYSRDEMTGETDLRKVEEVFVTEAHTIYHICLDSGDEIQTTAYHPFFAQNKGWVTAIQLQEGDGLATMHGNARISRLWKIRHEEPVAVYNFHVEEWASYFVSGSMVYVHNGNRHPEQSLYKQLTNFLWDKRNHIINGSRHADHHWELLFPNKKWGHIKNAILKTMRIGKEVPYKTVCSKEAVINGRTVKVIFARLENGIEKISDAWVKID